VEKQLSNRQDPIGFVVLERSQTRLQGLLHRTGLPKGGNTFD